MGETEHAPVRLRRDAIYLKTEDGIFFRGPKGSFVLKGKSVYAAFHALVPLMDGLMKREAILEALGENQRSSVSSLLNLLIDRSIIRTVDLADAGTLDPAVARIFAPQLDFIAHFADRPHARFESFRCRKILLIGEGASFLSAGLALIKNGLRTLYVNQLDDLGGALDRFRAECAELNIRGAGNRLKARSPRLACKSTPGHPSYA